MSIGWDTRNKRYRFAFDAIIAGRRHRASKLLPAAWSKAQALAYDRRENARLYAVSTGIEQDRPLISHAIALYIQRRLGKLRNGKKAAQDLSHLVPWVQGRFLDELPDISRDYADAHDELAPATIRNRLSYLRAAVRYAHKEHAHGDRDYTSRMRIPAAKNERHVYLRPDEIAKLCAHCDDETAALVRIAFYTGLRWRSDLLTLTPENVIDIPGKGTWISITQAKTEQPIMVPVHPSIKRDLEWLPFRLGDHAYYERFWRAREAAGLKHVRIHDLRHSLASALISDGATLAEVGQALGHKSLIATNRYAHLYPERVRSAVLRLANIARKRK